MKDLYKHSRPLIILSLAFLFAGCKGKTKESKKPKDNPPVIVDVLIAAPQTINSVIEANGTVIAREFVELHPEVSGRLTYLNLPEGKKIAQGTVIARINDADLRAQITKSQVQLDLAQQTADRYKELLAVNGLNQADYDAVAGQVSGYRADISYTRALVDKTVIRAPFSGVVGLRQVSPGAYVTPATVIATLQQTSTVKIDFTIPEMYANVIKVGAEVDIQLDGNVNNKNQATVVAVEPGANTDTRNLRIRAILKDATANPGTFVKVLIDEGRSRSSVKVPTNCIIPDDQNNQLVLVKNGHAKFVDVKTGVREANTVEITSGVQVGDSIVVTGVLFARPNSVVKVRSVKNIDNVANAPTGK